MSSENSSLLSIGRIAKSNGTDGEVVITLSVDPEDIDLREPVFIEFDGLPVPFFIESHSQRGRRKILAHLTDIHSFDDAEEIVGKEISIEYQSEEGNPFDDEDFSLLVGWELYDCSDGEAKAIGKITDYLDIPGNPCIEVGTANDAVLIPFHEDLISFVDAEGQAIGMNLPAGII